MERLEQEGEQYLQKEEGGNQQQSGGYDQQQGSGNYDQQQQGGGYDQQQSGNDMNERSNQQQDSSNSGNSSGGGFMKNMEGNTEDAYINNEANKFMTKEGVPGMADGAIDGVIDTEFNKYK